jgi:LacI family transcriptional regulator
LPTIKDVARAAGVSVATVSYVINDGPRSVTDETRARVMETMRQLGYEPNISARRLRLNRTNVLGLAVAGLSGLPGLADLYFLDIIRGISITADQHEYNLMLLPTHVSCKPQSSITS